MQTFGFPRSPTVGTSRFLTPEVRKGRKMAQIMTIWAPAFDRIVIEIQPAAETQGNVVFELYEEETTRLVRRVTAPARRVAARQRFAIEFAPISESFGRQYRLEVSMPEALDGRGIQLWAFDSRAGEDALIVDGTHALSELVFETGSTVLWSRFVNRLWHPRPGAAGPAVFIAFFVLANIALALILWTIAGRPVIE